MLIKGDMVDLVSMMLPNVSIQRHPISPSMSAIYFNESIVGTLGHLSIFSGSRDDDSLQSNLTITAKKVTLYQK
jgi:hypothetical protein